MACYGPRTACSGPRRVKDKVQRRPSSFDAGESPLKFVACGASSVSLEVPSGRLPEPWALQVFRPGGWLYADSWLDVTDLVVNSADGLTRVEVLNLDAESDYTFRVAQNTDLQVMASTASRPQAPQVRVMRRRPGGLAVQVVPQTSLLANLECELQWHKASAMGTWSSKIVKCEDGWGVCEVLLGDLASCSDYRLRARLRNAVGWAEDFSAEAFGRTSESAGAPSDLRLAARHPGRVILECSLADPEGAPVTSLEVQLCGQVAWRDIPSTSTAATASWDWDDLGGGPQRVVQVEVALPSDQVSQLRVWSRNIVGRSLLPSPALLCQPSSRPGAVSELRCPRRGLGSLQLDWSTYDPEGAPVRECSVEFWQEDAMWPTTQQVTDVVRTRQDGPSIWKASLEGLQTETSYVVRVRSRNEVGWSEEPLKLPDFRTADRPEAPTDLHCGDVTATSIQLHFDLRYDSAQLAAVPGLTGIWVEQAFALSWQPLSAERVEILEAVTADGEGGGPAILRARVRLQGLEGDSAYAFRVWPENKVGRSLVPSPALDCRTSPKPQPPTKLSLDLLGPNHARLRWRVADPSGAPVSGASCEVAAQSMFGAWQPVAGPRPQRAGRNLWTQIVLSLEPAKEYMFRVKAQNASGSSEWSEALVWSMPTPATISQLELQRLVDAPSTGTAKKSTAALMLTFHVTAPTAAPVAVCSALCHSAGRKVVAKRSEGKWVAFFPGVDVDPLANRFRVEAANAVGWSTCEEVLPWDGRSIEKSGQSLPGNLFPPLQDHVAHFLQSFGTDACRQWDEWEQYWAARSADPEDGASLVAEQHLMVQLTRAALAQAVRLKEKADVAWATRCEDFLASEPSTGAAEAAALAVLAFRLLLEGCFSAEQLRSDAESIWQDVLMLAEASAEANSREYWTGKHDEWASQFEERFAACWLPSCFQAVRMLSALAGRGSTDLLLGDALDLLRGQLHLHSWMEQSCQDARAAADDLYQAIIGSDVALSIYELHGTAAVTALTELAGLGGAFHVGVQVYWLEWSFGWCAEGSGIQALHFGKSDLGRFRQRLPLGRTPFSPEEVLALLRELRRQWEGKEYDLLRRNCAHFCIEFVKRLHVEEAPDWVNALAVTGGQVAEWLGVFRPALHQNAEASPATASRSEEEPEPASDLQEWRWAKQYILRRSSEARRIRQRFALSASASLRRPRRGRQGLQAEVRPPPSPRSQETGTEERRDRKSVV